MHQLKTVLSDSSKETKNLQPEDSFDPSVKNKRKLWEYMHKKNMCISQSSKAENNPHNKMLCSLTFWVINRGSVNCNIFSQ